MNHRFITVLYDSGHGLNPGQVQRCMDFINRYGYIVHLVTNVPNLDVANQSYYECTEKGFIYYLLFNKWLIENQDIDSLTLIDCDIVFPEGYFENVMYKMTTDKALIIHGFSTAYNVHNGQCSVRYVDSIIKNYKLYNKFQGHSGYTYSFSKAVLNKINWKFPECFLIGGFDYFLASCMLPEYSSLVNRCPKMEPILQDFYNKLRNVEYDYLDQSIYHVFHGSSLPRLTRWGQYHLLNDKLIKSYFLERGS